MTCFHPIQAWQRTSWNLNTTHEHSVTTFFNKYDNNLLSLLPNKNDFIEQKRKFHSKISFRYIPNAKMIEIPCNHCIGCLLDHANNWAVRLMLEAQNWKHSYFVTLTYNEANRHKDHKLHRKDMTDFWKRLRWHYQGEESITFHDKTENPIRYFYCGEYGGKRGREHFHALIFNINLDDLKFYKYSKSGEPLYTSKKLSKIWGFGFCPIGKVTYKSACYVARYTQKKLGIKPKTHYYKDIYDPKKGKMVHKKLTKKEDGKEFVLMSRRIGIGRLYWEKYKEKIIKNENIIISTTDKQGKAVARVKAIPKYFLKLLNKEDWLTYEKIKYNMQKKAQEYKKKILEIEHFHGTEEERWKQHLEKIEQILLDKAKLLKRNNFV